MPTPVDEYLAKQLALEQRITEMHTLIRTWKKGKGMAKHRYRDKIRDARRTLEMLEYMKENDSLPWEPGFTLEMDALSTAKLAELR
jgi:hypothetical protein